MDQQALLKNPVDYNTLDFLGAFSRTGRGDVMGMAVGRITIGTNPPQKACLVIYDNAYGFFFGFRPFDTGLKYKAHREDFMIPIQDVTALHVGGASQQTAPQYAASPRLHLQTGQPFLQVTSLGRQLVQFTPRDAAAMPRTGIMASKILAGQRTVYSAKVRGDAPAPPAAAPAPAAEEPQCEPGTTRDRLEVDHIGHSPQQVMPSALRYFPASDTYDVGLESYVLPCQQFKMDEALLLPGYLVIDQDNFGFFEPEDIEAATIQGRSPLVGKVSDLTNGDIAAPLGVTFDAPEGMEFCNVNGSPEGIMLTINDYYSTFNFAVDYGGPLRPEENNAVLAALEAVAARLAADMDPLEDLED